MKKSFLIILFLYASSLPLIGQKALKAIDAIHDEDFNKAFEYLQKGLAKNPLDPANDFVLANIYSAPQFQLKAIDSAHFYILAAKNGFQGITEKDKRKYIRKGMDSATIQSLHMKIDSLAFFQVKQMNTSQAYNKYIKVYDNSVYYSEAVVLRNKSAYAEALAEKTPEALATFFKLYPNAPQAIEAREVFENLYYEQFVAAQTEAVYKAYIEERPHTIFAEKAAIKLLALKSTYVNAETLRHFYEDYGKYNAARVAKDFYNQLGIDQRFPQFLSHYKNGEHYFFNVRTKKLENLTLPYVKTDSCKWINRPVIKIPLNNEKLFLNLGLDTIYYGAIVEESVLNGQWLKLKERGSFKYRLIHLSGNKQLQQSSSDFKYISPFFYLENQNDNWWLKTFVGEPLIKSPVDSIWSENNLFFFKEANKMAISNLVNFKKHSLKDFSQLAFLYTDYEWLNDSLLWLASDDYETVVDMSLNIELGLSKASIKNAGNYYFVNQEGGTILYDGQLKELWSGVLSNMRVNEDRLAIQQYDKWALQNWVEDKTPQFKYDSVRIFNPWLAYAADSLGSYLIFENYAKHTIRANSDFRILNSYNLSEEESKRVKYVLLTHEDKKRQLFNGAGEIAWEGENADVKVVSSDLVYIKSGKEQLILDNKGQKFSLGNIQAIGIYENGAIPILSKNKFGVYICKKNIIIPPKSDAKMTVFIPDSIFVYQEGDKLGLLNQDGILIEPSYQEIKAVNDSLALVEEASNWHLINIKRPKTIIATYNYIKRVVLADSPQYKVRQESGFGILASNGQLIIPPIFNSLEVMEIDHQLFWIAERNLPEVDFKVLVYFDAFGNVLFKEGLTNDEFEKNYCD